MIFFFIIKIIRDAVVYQWISFSDLKIIRSIYITGKSFIYFFCWIYEYSLVISTGAVKLTHIISLIFGRNAVSRKSHISIWSIVISVWRWGRWFIVVRVWLDVCLYLLINIISRLITLFLTFYIILFIIFFELFYFF